MTLEGQRPQTDRYTVIPRTLSFLISRDRILLMKLGQSRGDWAGLYNGLGGHIERGESPHDSARREIEEETGLAPQDLKLCGIVIIDVGGDPGIGLYVFVGRGEGNPIKSTEEGEPTWILLDDIDKMPLVPDLPTILPASLDVYRGEAPPFSGFYSFSEKGDLSIELGP
ncbi:MAG: NUDIX hydrolase [Anaerolineales bacterium]